MMRCIKIVAIIAICLCGFSLLADNLRLTKEVRVVSATDQSMELEVSLSWNNSWKNRHNSDAVYLFGKYKASGATEWHHLYFSTTSSDHSSDAAIELLPVNGGRGLFLRRSAEGSGRMEATLRLKANPKGNTLSPFTASDISSGRVLFSIQGIEMVQVPTAPFYAGDKSAARAFSDPSFGTILPEYDLINTTSGYTYSSNGSESSYASRAADHSNLGVYNASSRRDWCGTAFPATWQVDFKSPKTILYFGVSGVSSVSWGGFPPAPAGTWFLEGSSDGTNWTPVWSGGSEQWIQSAVSYPVQAIRVSSPGSYRYYRIRVEDTQCPALWNNIRISNVGMTDRDLATVSSASPVCVALESSVFPTTYPNGFHGFYAMKYELSQEQYVTFLNMLSRSAQYGRTVGGLLDALKEGEYVFGDQRNASSFRNGIILKQRNPNTELPCVFAHDVSGADLNNSDTDGQTVACNYLSPSDMLAYADWSGLRPLSELEYEKMCRGYFLPDPDAGAFAWGASPADPLTGITHPGEETEGLPNGSTANTNLNGGIGTPVRVGIFTRPGIRERAGISYWGVSDLTGNLSEIYCNTEIYGRQLNRSIHGGGQLDMAGGSLMGKTNWPREAAAYGVRGSDYTTLVGSASAFDRSRAADYFTGMDQRMPTTGVRLGFSIEPLRVTTQLTLENGLRSSSSLVYDTICASVPYHIRGDRHGASDVPAAYFWYESVDDGASWQLLDEMGQDIVLPGLTARIPANTVRRFRYKRISMGMEDLSETGAVCLVVAHGSSMSPQTVTLYPCMAPPTLTITTPLPSTFQWICLENGKSIATSGLASNSSYTVKQNDLKTSDERPNGRYSLEIRMTMAGKCVQYQQAEVFCTMETLNPFSVSSETLTWSSSGSYTTAHLWGGEDTWTWSVYSPLSAVQINSAGTITGKASTAMGNIVVGLTCNACPDKEWTKSLKETRTWDYTGGYQTITLMSGSYQVECWGASGGGTTNQSIGSHAGLGGYSTGILDLGSQQNIYMYIGGVGSGTTGGWNGGGNGYSTGYGGGGATDVRLVNGTWNTLASLVSRIMVAGGGGGGDDNLSEAVGAANDGSGGAGGGLTGGAAKIDGAVVSRSYYVASTANGGGCGMGGTQVYGFALGQGEHATCPTDTGGAGGGYRGGYVTNHNNGGAGGGSGFVSGMSGCNAVNTSGANTGSVTHYSGLSFRSASMVNASRSGHGTVRITVK